MRSIKEECLSRMIFFSEKQLRTAVGQFVEHYHSERNHQGLANRLIEPELERDNGTGKVICESRLGSLLNHYRKPPEWRPSFGTLRGTLAEKRMAQQKLLKGTRDCWSWNVERTPRSFWEITAPQEGAKISPPAIHASSSQQKTITPNDAL